MSNSGTNKREHSVAQRNGSLASKLQRVLAYALLVLGTLRT